MTLTHWPSMDCAAGCGAGGKGTKLTTLLLPGIGTLHDLKRARDLGVTSVRIPTHGSEADGAAQHIATARELGMDVAGFLMPAETGATMAWAEFNVMLAAGMLRKAAGLTTQVAGETISSDSPGCLAMSVRRPAGAVLGIVPWNAPVILGVRALAAPLACGNSFEGHGRVPLLHGCTTRLQCRTSLRCEGGDYIIFSGEVLTFDRNEIRPCLFPSGEPAGPRGPDARGDQPPLRPERPRGGGGTCAGTGRARPGADGACAATFSLTVPGRELTLHMLAAVKAIESELLGKLGHWEALSVNSLLLQLVQITDIGLPDPWGPASPAAEAARGSGAVG